MNEHALIEVIDRLRNRYYGKYRGTVSEIEAKTGRIKAYVPAVLGKRQPTGWCMPCVPYAGDDAGIVFLPEKGAGVWIEFEGGDVSFPIWVGCYWHDGELPRLTSTDVKMIKTKHQQIIFEDQDHDRAIWIADPHENKVTLDSKGVAVVRGSGKLTVSDGKVSANDGAMEVN
jgi:uncharacterized protein involved in type VI secretion and phage assembly